MDTESCVSKRSLSEIRETYYFENTIRTRVPPRGASISDANPNEVGDYVDF